MDLGQILTFLFYSVRVESIISLKKIPPDSQVCLNDIIDNSLSSVVGRDTEPKRTIWVDSSEIVYESKRSQRNSSLFAEISFNRKINYVPSDPRATAVAFVSGKRQLRAGDLRIRIPRNKAGSAAVLITVLTVIFWLAEGTNGVLDLWKKLRGESGSSNFEVRQNSSGPNSPNINGNNNTVIINPESRQRKLDGNAPIADLLPFAGIQAFIHWHEDNECVIFTQNLARRLMLSNWKPTLTSGNPSDDGMSNVVLEINETRGPTDKSESAAVALKKILDAEKIITHIVRNPKNPLPTDAMYVRIGPVR